MSNEKDSQLGIYFENILDLIPGKKSVLIRCGHPHYCKEIIMKDKVFMMFKFEAVKWVRKRKDPGDRYFQFETVGDDGVWSYEKESNLIRSRMTRSEKENT